MTDELLLVALAISMGSAVTMAWIRWSSRRALALAVEAPAPAPIDAPRGPYRTRESTRCQTCGHDPNEITLVDPIVARARTGAGAPDLRYIAMIERRIEQYRQMLEAMRHTKPPPPPTPMPGSGVLR